jgi:hypothetical protein
MEQPMTAPAETAPDFGNERIVLRERAFFSVP